MSEKNQKYILSGILILTALVFANSLGNGFIENFDDNVYVLNNGLIRHLNWNSLKFMFLHSYSGYYHPLALLSYAIEYKFFGANPFVFHLSNYILHLLNTLLVYLFLKRFTGKFWVAAITAMFFGIHPMHVESIAWIAERKDMLYTFFFLLSLISYTKYLQTDPRFAVAEAEARNKKSYLTWTFIWFVLSLLSKPAAACLPLVLVLMDYYQNKKVSLNSILWSKIPFFVLSLFFGIMAVISVHTSPIIQDISPVYSILDRIFLITYSTSFYLSKAFAPFSLSALHYYPAKLEGMLPIEYYLSLPFLLLLIFGVYKSGRFKMELVFGLLFYLATIILELQILPAGQAIVSERYSYVPYIGVFFIVGQFFSYIKENTFSFSKKIKHPVSIILVALVVFYSFLTYQRNKIWQNGEVLFTDVISKYPQNGFSWYALGNSDIEKKDFKAAIVNYTKAIQLEPYLVRSYVDRGLMYNQTGDYQSAMRDYTKAIELDKNLIAAYLNRASTENELQKFDSAIIDYTKSIELDPNLTTVYFARGLLYNQISNYPAAIADYTKAIELDSTTAPAYFNRGIIYYRIGKYHNAISDYTQTLTLRPNDTMAYYGRGVAEADAKKYADAIADFTKAIKLHPQIGDYYFHRANAKYRLKDYEGAVADNTTGLQFSPNDPNALFNRALAKFFINDKTGACRDWSLAQQYGNTNAPIALKQYCK